jgi:DSF synthase
MKINVDLHAPIRKLQATTLGRLVDAKRDNTSEQLELWLPNNGASAGDKRYSGAARTTFDAELARGSYRALDLTFDAHDEAIWCFMRPKGPPSFTPLLLGELISARRNLQRIFAKMPLGEAAPVKYFVGGSRLPGIYNLGGDLTFFIECIRARDIEALRNYAHDCVDVAYHMTVGLHLPLTTIALIQGDALGGGLEGALSFNVLVAEKSAKFGVPEILFNMFPGMGAFSFLTRKLGAARAQRMILSGRIYSAAELFDMCLIDVVAEDGRGEEAVRDYIVHNRRQHAVHQRIRDVNMRVNPLSLKELRDVTDIWAEHAIRLEEADLRKMERLANAQLRRLKAMRS